MRISSSDFDSGYIADFAEWLVFINGVRQHHCITADEDKGEALIYNVNEHGVMYAIDGDVTRLVRGRIFICRGFK